MRIIDISGGSGGSGKIPLFVSIRKALTEGVGWQAESDARDQITAQIGGILGPDFTILKGVILPGLDTPIPLVLIGPSGLYVLSVSALKGTFRARGDVWLGLDTSGNMHPVKPNLPTRTRLYAEAVRKFLLKNNIQMGEIEAVLLFSRNDAFVENIKAPIRIVLADGIENYASSLCLAHPSLPPEQATSIIRLLAGSKAKSDSAETSKIKNDITAQAVVMPSAEPEDSILPPENTSLRELFSDQTMARQIAAPLEPSSPAPASKTDDEGVTGGFTRQAHLTRSQTLVLVVFSLLDVCAIIALLSLAIYLFWLR